MDIKAEFLSTEDVYRAYVSLCIEYQFAADVQASLKGYDHYHALSVKYFDMAKAWHDQYADDTWLCYRYEGSEIKRSHSEAILNWLKKKFGY